MPDYLSANSLAITKKFLILVIMIYIKHQSRLKVLQKFHYSKRDISATLVEAVFKLMKVQR